MWCNFGLLRSVECHDEYILITNNTGDKRKMNRSNYQEAAARVLEKAQQMIGQEVLIRTSKDVNHLQTREWFSAIEPALLIN